MDGRHTDHACLAFSARYVHHAAEETTDMKCCGACKLRRACTAITVSQARLRCLAACRCHRCCDRGLPHSPKEFPLHKHRPCRTPACMVESTFNTHPCKNSRHIALHVGRALQELPVEAKKLGIISSRSRKSTSAVHSCSVEHQIGTDPNQSRHHCKSDHHHHRAVNAQCLSKVLSCKIHSWGDEEAGTILVGGRSVTGSSLAGNSVLRTAGEGSASMKPS